MSMAFSFLGILLLLNCTGNCDLSLRRQQLVTITVHETAWKSLRNYFEKMDVDVVEMRHAHNKVTLLCVVRSKSLRALRSANIKYEVLPVDPNRSFQEFRNLVNPNHTYADIVDQLSQLESKAIKGRRIVVTNIGRSFQQRPIKMIQIEHIGASTVIFINAGIHGRDWLSVRTAMFLAEGVAEANMQSSVSEVNWYIVPCVNPDGYIYTHKAQRLHKKNMNFTLCHHHCQDCGVDLDRNFGFQWEATGTPCFKNYAGSGPFSESESAALAATLEKYAENIKLYLSLQGSSYQLLYPWGYIRKKCNDCDDLKEAAETAMFAMNNNGTDRKYRYRVGNVAEVFRPMSGGASDYAKGRLHIKYSYLMQLQYPASVDTFEPTEEEVQHFVVQNYVGITAMARCIIMHDTHGDYAVEYNEFLPNIACNDWMYSSANEYKFTARHFAWFFFFLVVVLV